MDTTINTIPLGKKGGPRAEPCEAADTAVRHPEFMLHHEYADRTR
jgi:hypothetical protein